jgi:hypothetical protein
MHCHVHAKLELEQKFVQGEKKTKSACNWVGYTIHMGSATRINCIMILFFFF